MRTNRGPGRLSTSHRDKERWEGAGGKEGGRVFWEEQRTEPGNEKGMCRAQRAQNGWSFAGVQVVNDGLRVRVGWLGRGTLEWLKEVGGDELQS